MLFGKTVGTGEPQPRWFKQLKSLAIILRDEFRVPFRFYDAATGMHIADMASEDDRISSTTPSIDTAAGGFSRLVAEGLARITPLDRGQYQVVLPFPAVEGHATVAVGVLDGLARTPADAVQEQVRLGKWLQAVHFRLLDSHCSPGRHRHRPGSSREGDTHAGLQTLMSLEQLLRTQRLDEGPAANRLQILQAAARAAQARTLLWVGSEADETVVVGEDELSPWDSCQLARVLRQDPEGAKAGFIVNNRVAATSWGARFPRVDTLLAVPVPIKSSRSWIIALNKMADHGSPVPAHPAGSRKRAELRAGSSQRPTESSTEERPAFRRTDAALLMPFAALLSLHLRASRRDHQLRGLTIGLTRSLAAAVDARDIFLVGHSERVARIAVELARELGLQETDLSDVYLSGLLHDVGKIGIPDTILRKPQPLSANELYHVRQHVTIGAKLVGGLEPIAHLLPAVLHHHERYDGTGYPAGLKGDTIPFLARILAVAEGYDAITTFNGERAEGPCGTVEEILAEGADRQWDGRVVGAFFRCRDRILTIQQRALSCPLDAATRPSAASEPDAASLGKSLSTQAVLGSPWPELKHELRSTDRSRSASTCPRSSSS